MNFKSCIFTGSLITCIVASSQQVKAVNINSSHSNNLTIEKISDVSRITQMVFGPDQRLYAITVNQGVLSFAYDLNTGQISDQRSVVDINGLGIGFQGNTMYLTSFNKIIRLTDDNNNGLYGQTGETNVNLVEGLPTGNHDVNQIQIQGNTLYVGIGTRTIDGFNRIFGNPDTLGETSYGGSISWIQDLTLVPSTANAAQLRDGNGNLLENLDFLTDGTPYTSTDVNKLVVQSAGIRNPFGLAFDANGQLWATNNYNRARSNGNGTSTPNPNDAVDNNLVENVYDQFFRIAPKANYGYENSNWRNNTTAINAGFFNPNQIVRSTTFDNLFTSSFIPYDPSNPNGLGPSASANGFSFYKGNQLSTEYQNKAFVTRFTRGPVRQPNGQYSVSYGDVVLVDPTTGDVSQLVQGLFNPLAILADLNGVTIADFNGGIYRISAASTAVPDSSNVISLLVLGGLGISLRLKKSQGQKTSCDK